MAHKLCNGSYVHTLHTMQSKPSSAGDSKTTVSTYAAVIHYNTVVKIEALTCSLPDLVQVHCCVTMMNWQGAELIAQH